MNFKKKMIAVIVLACMAGAAVLGGTLEMRGKDAEREGFSLFDHKTTLYFWYTDDELTDFVNSAAVAFGERRGDARVLPQLVSDSEYLEAINEASLRSEQMPDIFMISNDSLEKAYLAGLAGEIADERGVLSEQNFPPAALSAVTYHDKLVAYPLFYETSALVYNETYLREWARQQAQREAEENGVTLDEAALAQRTEELMGAAIPATVDDILNVADTFDVPEGVEGVMKWDVTNIFYNYWIVGNYMIVGGDAGDKEDNINISNPETARCLEVYKALNQFFYIESDTVTYDSVIQDFIDGKTVYTIATTDVVKRLAEAKEAGVFAYDYGITVMPKVSPELESRSMSVTASVAVNGYSLQKELANEFAAFLTNDYADYLYERTGRASANLGVEKENGALQMFMQEYAVSVPLPKMIEASNFWIQLEILFSKVWNGADVNGLLQDLSNQILTQAGIAAG